jgi:hypothetical protein
MRLNAHEVIITSSTGSTVLQLNVNSWIYTFTTDGRLFRRFTTVHGLFHIFHINALCTYLRTGIHSPDSDV